LCCLPLLLLLVCEVYLSFLFRMYKSAVVES
jgi:hypothetical protein